MKIKTIPRTKTAGWLMIAALPVFVIVFTVGLAYSLTYDWMREALLRIIGEENNET